MKKKIAIIGAGIAGLTLANFLKRNANFDFMLYEKKDNLSLEEGFGLQLSINSISILNKIGFEKINSDEIFHPENLDFFTIENKKICNLKISKFNTEKMKYTTLKRSTLIEFLKDEIYTQHLRFGKNIKEIFETKGKILIKFDDNTNDLVDYVVAADGIFSNTKTFFEKKNNQPLFNKAVAIRTIIKNIGKLDIDEKNISILMGSDLHVVIYPINKNNELNLVSIIRNKKYQPDKINELVEKKLFNQNSNFKSIIKADIKSWPLYSSPKILPSSNKKVFYLGDAFGTVLPTLAQGAGQSIESAYELFNLIIKDNGNFSELYFNERLKRVNLVKRRSNLNFFVFHLSTLFLKQVRNFFLKILVKNKIFLNKYLGEVYKN